MTNNKKITVVYFAYLLGNWDVFLEQLKLVKESGLYDDTDNFYLCATINDVDISKLYEIINKYPKITLYYHGPENTYEYHGLKCFYETAEDNAYSFYFHTKSIFNDNPLNIKIRYILHKNIIMNYKECVSYLDSGYTKVSCFKHSEGFCWFNFFWETGSFIKTLDIPIKTPNRYDYEVWQPVMSIIIMQHYQMFHYVLNLCWIFVENTYYNYFLINLLIFYYIYNI